MSKRYEVVVVTGKYKDADGKEKNRYLTIGAVIATKTGPMLKLEAVPVGWDGWAFLNEPRVREEAAQRRTAPAPRPHRDDAADDDVPF